MSIEVSHGKAGNGAMEVSFQKDENGGDAEMFPGFVYRNRF
jgi:hypothetical protein